MYLSARLGESFRWVPPSAPLTNSTNRVLPFPDLHSGPPMDSAIVPGTLFTLMAIGVVLAGVALTMM
jgi:hypothetical protein